MSRTCLSVVGCLVLLTAATGAGQQPPPPSLPEWMDEFLPRTPDDRARAAVFDALGHNLLQLDRFSGGLGCGRHVTLPRPAYHPFVADIACSNPFIVVGTARPVAARFNNRGTYIYTEHAFTVRRWLHPTVGSSLEIPVLTEGGVLHVGEQKTGIFAQQDLEPDKEYLLFLKQVQATDAFAVVGLPLSDRPGWFSSLRGNLPHAIEDDEVPFDRFVDDLAIAAGNCRAPRASRVP